MTTLGRATQHLQSPANTAALLPQDKISLVAPLLQDNNICAAQALQEVTCTLSAETIANQEKVKEDGHATASRLT